MHFWCWLPFSSSMQRRRMCQRFNCSLEMSRSIFRSKVSMRKIHNRWQSKFWTRRWGIWIWWLWLWIHFNNNYYYRKNYNNCSRYKLTLIQEYYLGFKLYLNLVDCEWNDWGSWNQCSKSCNSGTQKRTRRVLRRAKFGGKQCSGRTTETRRCNEIPCLSKIKFFLSKYLWLIIIPPLKSACHQNWKCR